MAVNTVLSLQTQKGSNKTSLTFQDLIKSSGQQYVVIKVGFGITNRCVLKVAGASLDIVVYYRPALKEDRLLLGIVNFLSRHLFKLDSDIKISWTTTLRNTVHVL